MGYLRNQLKTRRGRRVALGMGVLLFIWVLVRCGDNSFKPPALVYLPQGSTAEMIHALQNQNVPLSSEDALDALRGQNITPGWIRFNPYLTITPKDFFTRLLRPERESTRRVVMYSGETIQLFAEHLASQTLLPQGKLLNAYYQYSPYSDGGILAGHYHVPYRTTTKATMHYLVSLSEKRFHALSKRYKNTYDPATFKRTLIIASIIQKETWHTEEMPQIASVIFNRLERNMKLQLDATLNYGPYAHTPVTPERIRSDASRYNTYRHKGLPPEPISSVTEAAITAAFHPNKTNYLFFVRNAQGTHDFATTYTEHLTNIARIKAEKKKQNIENNATITADKL